MNDTVVPVMDEVEQERRAQVKRWGGLESDKKLSEGDWLVRLAKQAGQAAGAALDRSRPTMVRHHLVQIIALCEAWELARGGEVRDFRLSVAEEAVEALSHEPPPGQPFVGILSDLGWAAQESEGGFLDGSDIAALAVRTLVWAIRLGAAA